MAVPLLSLPTIMIAIMAKSYVKIINKSKNRDSKVIENFKKIFFWKDT